MAWSESRRTCRDGDGENQARIRTGLNEIRRPPKGATAGSTSASD